MNRFTIIALVIMGLGLYRDYKRDAGLNRKAKIYHAILLTLLLASYAGSFGIVGAIIRNFEGVKNQFSVDVGIVPGQVHLFLYFLHTLVSLAVLVFAYQMISRKETARKRLVTLLPLLGILSVFSFYRGWLNTPDELILSDGMIILIGVIIMGGLTMLYMKIYNSEWMKKFFTFEPEPINLDSEIENE